MLDAACEDIVHTRGTPEFHSQDGRRRQVDQPKKVFEATQMWDIYQEIARRIVLGQKNVEIANDLGVTPAMISYVRNSPIVQERINKLQAAADGDAVSVSRRIKALAPQALDLIEQLIVKGKVEQETIPAKVRAEFAKDMLDRAGHGAVKEIKASHLHGHFTSDDIEKLKARALGGAIEAAVIVEDE